MEEVKGTLIVSLFMISHGQVLLINRSKRKFRSCNWLEAFCHLASLWTLLWLNKCQVMPWQIKLGTQSWSTLNVKKHNDELFIRRGLHNRQLCGVNTKQELHFEQFWVFYAVKMIKSGKQDMGLWKWGKGNRGDPTKRNWQKKLICRDETDFTWMVWINEHLGECNNLSAVPIQQEFFKSGKHLKSKSPHLRWVWARFSWNSSARITFRQGISFSKRTAV